MDAGRAASVRAECGAGHAALLAECPGAAALLGHVAAILGRGCGFAGSKMVARQYLTQPWGRLTGLDCCTAAALEGPQAAVRHQMPDKAHCNAAGPAVEEADNEPCEKMSSSVPGIEG